MVAVVKDFEGRAPYVAIHAPDVMVVVFHVLLAGGIEEPHFRVRVGLVGDHGELLAALFPDDVDVRIFRLLDLIVNVCVSEDLVLRIFVDGLEDLSPFPLILFMKWEEEGGIDLEVELLRDDFDGAGGLDEKLRGPHGGYNLL